MDHAPRPAQPSPRPPLPAVCLPASSSSSPRPSSPDHSSAHPIYYLIKISLPEIQRTAKIPAFSLLFSNIAPAINQRLMILASCYRPQYHPLIDVAGLASQ